MATLSMIKRRVSQLEARRNVSTPSRAVALPALSDEKARAVLSFLAEMGAFEATHDATWQTPAKREMGRALRQLAEQHVMEGVKGVGG